MQKELVNNTNSCSNYRNHSLCWWWWWWTILYAAANEHSLWWGWWTIVYVDDDDEPLFMLMMMIHTNWNNNCYFPFWLSTFFHYEKKKRNFSFSLPPVKTASVYSIYVYLFESHTNCTCLYFFDSCKVDRHLRKIW